MPGADELKQFKQLLEKLAHVPKREIDAKRAESKKRKTRGALK